MANILTLNGPNLNLLGTREPERYGSVTLEKLNDDLIQYAAKFGHQIFCFQSNSEAALIERIHQAPAEDVEFMIFNPAAFTHTSIALRDAILSVDIPFIEVHLTNVYAREPFRHHSYFSDIAEGVIAGLGFQSYIMAFNAIDTYLGFQEPSTPPPSRTDHH